MKQLKMVSIFALVKELTDSGMSVKEIGDLPIYLGDDDELNGIHCAWYAQPVEPNLKDDADLVELINERSGNYPITGKSILIS